MAPPRRCVVNGRGQIRRYTLAKPYRVDFTLRASYPDTVVAGVKALREFKLEQTGSAHLPAGHQQRARRWGICSMPSKGWCSGEPPTPGSRWLLPRAPPGLRRPPRHAQTPAPPRVTPRRPAADFGVTEYQVARQKLELDMQRGGFSVYIIADMEGLAPAVRNGTEMRPELRGGTAAARALPPGDDRRGQRRDRGARAGGATQFIVNEGHGGTLFRNVLVELSTQRRSSSAATPSRS